MKQEVWIQSKQMGYMGLWAARPVLVDDGWKDNHPSEKRARQAAREKAAEQGFQVVPKPRGA